MKWGQPWGGLWGLDPSRVLRSGVGGVQWVASITAGDQPAGTLEIFAASRDDLPTLHRALLISLFTDRRAEDDDELPTDDGDRRGWWADAFDEFPIGSRLWLLSASKVTDETANLARDYMVEALQWMITTGLATSVDVTVEVRNLGGGGKLIGGDVRINRDEANLGGLRFADLWTTLADAA